MKIEITGVDKSRKDAIQQACFKEWGFEEEDWICDEYYSNDKLDMEVSAESFLCPGESESDFAKRISKEIWKANDTFCPVTIQALNLEELPYNRHAMDKEVYKKIKENQNSPSK